MEEEDLAPTPPSDPSGKRALIVKIHDIKNDMDEKIYSDQTGKFPVKSRAGNRYIMVMVEIDSNYILVVPMKNKTDDEMIATYLLIPG